VTACFRRRHLTAVTVAAFLLLAGGVAGCTSPAARSSGPPCATTSGSWPMYQGNPARSANACSSITTSNVASTIPHWFFPTPGDVTATPTVANGTVYVGDSTGVFYAINQSDGHGEWTFKAGSAQSCYVDAPNPHTAAHEAGFGAITSSAAVQTIAGRSMVFVGAVGAVFALNATTGKCIWAQDTDPDAPASAIEVESSPVVDMSVNPPEVLVGNDDNGVPEVAVTGLMAFNARTGALLWKYEPERDVTLRPSQFGGSDALTLSCGDGVVDSNYCNSANIPDLAPNSKEYADACGDVWSSPTLDTSFVDPAGDNTFEGSAHRPAGWYPKQITASGKTSRDGLVVFGSGNCNVNPYPLVAEEHGDYIDNQSIFALDPVTGVRVWSWVEPYNVYDNNPKEPAGGDDDFGSSPVLTPVPSSEVSSARCRGSADSTRLVIEGSKDGYAYGLCEATGAMVWSNQVSQPGQLDAETVGSIGGYIASPSLGAVNGKATVFFDAAIPLPFTNGGILGSGDQNISSCPGAVLDRLPLLPVCPDLSLLAHASRLLPLSAVDAATGRVDWRTASVPTYAATSYTNGVVFAPQTTGFSIIAYDARTGLPIWVFPIGAAPSSAAAIAGRGIYLGAGTSFDMAGGKQIPPQATGVWGFTDLLSPRATAHPTPS
jgi:outer membrane protein assembly factor BamB